MDFTEFYEDSCSTVGLASRMGNLVKLRDLLSDGADYCIKDNRGWFPIHEAAFHGHTECVEELLKAAYDNDEDPLQIWPDPYDIESGNALVLAARNGHLDTVEMLLNTGLYSSLKDLQHAVKASLNHPTTLSYLLSKYEGDINYRICFNYTLLHEAVSKSPIYSIETLLKNGATVESKEDYGRTALHLVCSENRNDILDVVKLLVEKGSNVDSCDNQGCSVLFIATQYNHFKVIRFLLQKNADPNKCCAICPYGKIVLAAPLCVAAEKGHLPILKLLTKVSDKKMLKKMNVFSPVKSAIFGSNYDCLVHLLKNGYSLEKDCSLSEALHYFPSMNTVATCLKASDKLILKLLLKSGAHVKPLASCFLFNKHLVNDNNNEVFLLALQCGIGESCCGSTNVVWKLHKLWISFLNEEPGAFDFLKNSSSSSNVFYLLKWMPVVDTKIDCNELQVPSLICLCRYYIRLAILNKSGCIRLTDINQLFIPRILKDFLWLKTS